MTDANPDGRKVYFTGSHRVLHPTVTLVRTLPVAPKMGITRLAVLTGLDRIGIPVAAAVRPNSRSIAVHQGKGQNLEAAKVSALMEAVECYHAEMTDLPLRRLSFPEIAARADAAKPTELPRCRDRVYRGERLLWVEAKDLFSGRPFWVPYELVTLDFADEDTVTGLFQASTNGLAAGNHWLEAVLHALYETIERDAVSLWRARYASGKVGIALDPALLGRTAAQRPLAAFAQANVLARVWDITSDVGVPAFVCVTASSSVDSADEPELGSGCHLDRDVALLRALTEAAQSRLTRISGARDDFEAISYAPSTRTARRKSAYRWLAAPATAPFIAEPRLSGYTLQHDLNLVLDRLAKADIRHVGCVDLTRPELGIPVARLVVPGLEGPWTPPGADYSPGARALAVTCAL